MFCNGRVPSYGEKSYLTQSVWQLDLTRMQKHVTIFLILDLVLLKWVALLLCHRKVIQSQECLDYLLIKLLLIGGYVYCITCKHS